jgi:hypothetical protein
MSSNEALTKYLEALNKSYEVLAEAAVKASERGARVSKQLTNEILAGQRDVFALSKKVAAEPDHFASNSYAGLTEAAVAAQSRALAFAQAAYSEALTAGTESKEFADKLAAANKETAQAANELARSWATLNPLTEIWASNVEAFMKAAGQKTTA